MTQKSKMGLNWSCSMNMPRAFIMNKCTLYYQKVVILPLFVTLKHFPKKKRGEWYLYQSDFDGMLEKQRFSIHTYMFSQI